MKKKLNLQSELSAELRLNHFLNFDKVGDDKYIIGKYLYFIFSSHVFFIFFLYYIKCETEDD